MLDYIVQKADLSLKHKIYKSIFAVWNLCYQDSNGSYVDYNSKKVVNYKAVILLNPKIVWQYQSLQTYIEACNVLNTGLL